MGRVTFNPADTNHATAKETLGAVRRGLATDGSEAEYTYVQFVDNTVAAGDTVMLTATPGIVSSDITGGTRLAGGKALGVATAAVTADNYGYVLTKGYYATANVGGTTAAGSYLVAPDVTDGRAEPMGTAEEHFVFAQALTADTANVAPIIVFGL